MIQDAACPLSLTQALRPNHSRLRPAGPAGTCALFLTACLLLHSPPAFAQSSAVKPRKPPVIRLGVGLARDTDELNGPALGSIAAHAAVMRRVRETVALGLEGGFYNLGRFAYTSDCRDVYCEESYTDYFSSRVIHVGFLLDVGAAAGRRRPSFLGGIGYYRKMTSSTDPDNLDLNQDGNGVGASLGAAAPLVRLKPTMVLDLTARFHLIAVSAVRDGPDMGGFMTVTLGVKSN